jgi:hypothetical protein
MNAIAQTIKASQDAEAARKASAEAKHAMQQAVFAGARDRVAALIREFNETPMELQAISDGTPTGKKMPMHNSWGIGREYAMMGKGLRFFLCWAADGRTLVLMLNAVSRHAHNVDKLRQPDGLAAAKSVRDLEASNDLMTLKQAQDVVKVEGLITYDHKNFRVAGYITLDGRFGIGAAPYDEKDKPEFIDNTPAAWMTRIVSNTEIAPYVVLGEAPKKRGKAGTR